MSLGTTTFEQDEAALRSVREQIGLLERSFTSVQDGERRARARLDDAGTRLSALSASRRLAQDELSDALSSLNDATELLDEAARYEEESQSERREADEALARGGRSGRASPGARRDVGASPGRTLGRGRSGDHRRSGGSPRLVPRPDRGRHGMRTGRGVRGGSLGRRDGRRRHETRRARRSKRCVAKGALD